jgi:hypothetical protein
MDPSTPDLSLKARQAQNANQSITHARLAAKRAKEPAEVETGERSPGGKG